MRVKYLIHVVEDGYYDMFVIKGDGALYDNETFVGNTPAEAQARIDELQVKFPESIYTIIPVSLPDA